jgi:hypothetical protein
MKRRFRKVARQAGFETWEERNLHHRTCPVKLGVHAMERIAQPKPEASKVFGEWVNNHLFQISRMEQETLSTLPMPFGSSLIVLAYKGRAA